MKILRYVTVAILCLCGFLYGQEQPRSLGDIARELKKKSAPAKPCASATGNPARTTTTAVTDLADEPEACTYMEGVKKLLKDGKFSELERIAAAARSGKARFVGGGWKLYTFYMGVRAVPHSGATQSDWDAHLAILKNWLSNQPASVTPYVALADFYLADGWRARGDGTSDTVTEEGWRVFYERAKQARAILNQGRTLKMKCPQWYDVMMSVAVAQGWEPAEEKALFEEAIAFEPGYYYFYQNVGWYLMPKWHGQEGDLKNFAQTMADRIGGKGGDILYWQIAANVVAGSGNGPDGMDLSWMRIRRGYGTLVEKYGEPLLRQNEMCYMAVKFQDPLLAQELFDRIGENWNENIWHKREYFDKAKNWATAIAAKMQPFKDIYALTAANMETSEGKTYTAVVANQLIAAYAMSISQCAAVEPSQDGNVGVFLEVDKSGTMEQLLVFPDTAMSDCLRPKIQKVFPNPPKPDYWVSFYLNLH